MKKEYNTREDPLYIAILATDANILSNTIISIMLMWANNAFLQYNIYITCIKMEIYKILFLYTNFFNHHFLLAHQAPVP